ncbi:MAG: cupin domain-containing protein [Alphaproteobacteria bacterium]|nr:cupin domain-containing protein [Alphaproteobacteria bacterium]
MSTDLPMTPIRRVVTGTDEQGRSTVIWDGPAPNANQLALASRTHNTNIWVWDGSPLPLSGTRDEGDTPYEFPGPRGGGHVRVVETLPRQVDYDRASDPDFHEDHAPTPRPSGRSWDRGNKNSYASGMHKTQSVDFGILLAGERELILDDQTLLMKPGDVAVQVGAWHNWSSPRLGCVMAFDMIDAEFVDGPQGLIQGNDAVVRPPADFRLPDGVNPVRRIVTGDHEPGRSSLIADGPAPDVRFDPARPGFASARLWVIDQTPAKIVMETLHLPHTIEPPKEGVVCRVVTYPPDSSWEGKVGSEDVAAYFRSMGSANASNYSSSAPHPYMQRTETLDFCFILDGEIVLVLDTQTVALKAGDVVVQRGTNHAWSNVSEQPCVIACCSHDAAQ